MSDYIRPGTAAAVKGKRPLRLKKYWTLYALGLPALAAYFVWCYLPLAGWSIAFTKFQPGKSLFANGFVGFDHFVKFFKSSSGFGMVLKNTLGINLISLLLLFVTAAAFAVAINEIALRQFGRIVQMVSFFPYFMSYVVAYAIVYALFGMKSGAVNQLLVNTGIIKTAINVLGSEKAAWPMMIILRLWKEIGYYSIIFLASIVAIPAEESEADAIDGAGRWQRVWHITLPNIKRIFFIMLVLQFGNIFTNSLDQFFAFSNATNMDALTVFDMYVFRYGLLKSDYSYATAVGVIKSIVALVLLTGVNKLSKVFAETSVI